MCGSSPTKTCRLRGGVACCQTIRHTITGAKKLARAGRRAESRVAALKRLATQLEINQSHGLPNLTTACARTPLNDETVDVIQRAGRVVWGHWYRPSAHWARVEDGVAAAACGNLGREVARCLREKIHAARDHTHGRRGTGESGGLKLFELSCHDGNLLAFAALLGIDIEPPCFAAHWLIELHRSAQAGGSDDDGEWTVRLIYVPNPTKMDASTYATQLQPRRLPLNGRYIDYEACPLDVSGDWPAQELIAYLTDVAKPRQWEAGR